MTALAISDNATRPQLLEALGHMSHRASREMPVVGTPEHPTPWDARHCALDELLTLLDLTP